MSNGRAIAIGLGAAALVAGLVGIGVWASQDPPPESYTPVTFETLDPQQVRWVRLTGQAHYPATLRQAHPESVFREARTTYLFAFMPVNETGAREVPVLVSTQREPDRIVAYETMTIEGRLERPRRQLVPHNTELLFGEQAGYFFAEPVWVLRPVRIESEDGVWEEPGW